MPTRNYTPTRYVIQFWSTPLKRWADFAPDKRPTIIWHNRMYAANQLKSLQRMHPALTFRVATTTAPRKPKSCA